METKLKMNSIILWLIWLAIFLSLFLYQFLLGGGIPSGKNETEPPVVFMWIIGSEILIASFIRWVLIPKQVDNIKLLRLMIIGLALSESVQFIQIFVIGKNYPETQLSVFALSVFSVAQFIPLYAKKEDPKENNPSRFQ